MKIELATSGLTGLVLVATLGAASAQERHITRQQLPPAVQRAADQQSKGATVRGYSLDHENGQTEYEVETVHNGLTRDVAISASGQVEEVEQQVPLSQVPPAAMQAIRRGAKGGHILKVEKVTTPSSQSSSAAFEAGVKMTDGRYHEVRVHADGSPAPESD